MFHAQEELMLQALTTRYPNTTFTPTTDPFAKWDLESPKAIIELKSRRGANSRYPDTILERIKYDALIEEAAITGKTPLYVVHRQYDDTIYTFNLSAMEIDWITKEMRAQTDFDRSQRVEKVVGLLRYDQAAISFPV